MALRCVVVTPEKTQLDREAEYVSLPMFDGELGVLKGRAPMIGRLGYGTMKLQTAAGPERYYIDGGFAHVEGDEDILSEFEASDGIGRTGRVRPDGDVHKLSLD